MSESSAKAVETAKILPETPDYDMPIAGPSAFHFISQGLRLSCIDWGNEGAPILLLVHGGRDHARNWDRLAEEFRSDYHVLAPDLRGHGDSEHLATGHYSLEDYVLDITVLARRLACPINIVGHSLGGNIALRFSALYPGLVRRLTVIEGLGSAPDIQAKADAEPMDERLRAWIDQQPEDKPAARYYPTIEAAVARMMEKNPHLTVTLARHLVEHGTHRRGDGVAFKFDPRVRIGSPVDITTEQKFALWRQVSCPVMLAYGRESWASDPEKDGRASHFTNARLVMFDNAGHWVHHDRHDAFAAELRAFLA